MSPSRDALGRASDEDASPVAAAPDVASRFTCIAENIDVAPFLAELDAASDLWLADTSRQSKVRCQRATLNIFLSVARNPCRPALPTPTTCTRAAPRGSPPASRTR